MRVTTAQEVKDAIRTKEETERNGLFLRVEKAAKEMVALSKAYTSVLIESGLPHWLVQDVVNTYRAAGFKVSIEQEGYDPRDGTGGGQRIILEVL